MRRRRGNPRQPVRPGLELLEPRLLLTGSPYISEFLAINDTTLADEDGDYCDWIEIHNPAASAVDLTGWKLKDSANEWPFPSMTLGPGEYRVIFASDKDRRDPAGELHTNFKLDGDGEYLALVDATDTVVHPYAPTFPDQLEDISYGVLREEHGNTELVSQGASGRYSVPAAGPLDPAWVDPFYDDSGWATGTTGLGFGLSEGAVDPVTLVAARSVWKYLDDGSDQGAAWRQPSFGDGLWASGPAELGYGDGGEATFVSYGPDASNKHITTYFRHTFQASNVASFDTLTVRLRRDDGAVVYLNGQELLRSNMPAGSIDYQTLASDGVGGGDESRYYDYSADPSGLLAEGINVLAVEIHQRAPNSSDISFDLELIGRKTQSDLIATDVQDQVLGISPSVLVRATFIVTEPEETLDELILEMAYEDGYVAWLNGVQVAARNAPSPAGGDSTALFDRVQDDPVRFESVDLTDWLDLLVTGENVLAIHALNDAAGDGDFLVCPVLKGVQSVAFTENYFLTPTPGAANVPGALGMVDDTSFSVDRGFYDQPFPVEISTDTNGAEIRYTLDGSTPTATTGLVYSGPIDVTTTTTLRAAAFKPGWLPTNVDTQTYIFLGDVLQQPDWPAGFPTTWYTRAADYGMDPDVVNDPLYSNQVRDALQTHPTISLVMDLDDWFDEQTGIYSNSTMKGDAWEREVSVELIGFAGEEDMQSNTGIRLQGNASRQSSRPKHNLRLIWRSDYGDGRLDFRFFEDSSVTSFNSLILRGQNGDSWIHPSANQRRRAQYLRDQWHRIAQEKMGHESLDQGHVHVYINGLYWGLHHVFVRAEAEWMSEKFGGSEDDWDVVQDYNKQAGKVEVIDGDLQAWDAMMALANGNIADPATYAAIQDYLDMENLADYILLNFYSGNTDWDGGNWRAARKREPGAGFMFFPWDSERTVGDSAQTSLVVDTNVTGRDVANRPSHLHQRLCLNAEYRLFFADRVQKHFFNGGALSPSGAAASWQQGLDDIRLALVAEAARWGDAHRPDDPYTPEDEWLAEANLLTSQYFPVRTGIVLNQLAARGLYPNVQAASFGINGAYQHGGPISPGDALSISAPAGTIYYTLDGTDPCLPGGAVAPGAAAYTDPVVLEHSTLVKVRAYTGGQWSALNEAEYYEATFPPVRITELMYNPDGASPGEQSAGFDDGESFEFIEFQNVGERPFNLLGARFTDGIDFTFPSAVLGPGEYGVIVSSAAGFASRYDVAGLGIRILGEYTGSLNNGGETVAFESAVGEVVHQFTYDDEWYPHTDGEGFSLTILDPTGPPAQWDTPEAWISSSSVHGSPGGDDSGVPAGAIVISEVLAHSDLAPNDWIELRNTTGRDIDIGGWFLSDSDDNLAKFEIHAGTVIPAGGFAVFTQDHHFGIDPDGPGPREAFALSELGDQVYLSSGIRGHVTGYRESVTFGVSPTGVSFGPYVTGTGEEASLLLSQPSPGWPNYGPLVGDLVTNEVMYHPTDPPGGPYTDEDFEFLELYNRSAQPVDLRELYVSGGVGFTFGWYDTDASGAAKWTLQKDATARWTVSLPASGSYEVFARVDNADGIGGTWAMDSAAEYEFAHAEGPATVALDQNVGAGAWVPLGTFSFDAGEMIVTLRRGTDLPNERTIADGLRFVGPAGEVVVDDADPGFQTTGATLTTLGPGEYAVVVSNPAAFGERYDASGRGILVAGRYTGRLDNTGERLRLWQATTPEPTGYLPYYLSDSVRYDDQPPWPSRPDGGGSSLIRLSPAAYGDDLANWAASSRDGSPGAANVPLDTTGPLAPAHVQAQGTTATSIDVTWDPAVEPETSVTHYLLYRDGALLTAIAGTSHTDFGLVQTGQYAYQVSAVNVDGYEGPRSEPIVASPRLGLISAHAADGYHVVVEFTAALDPTTAEDPAHYIVWASQGGEPVAVAAVQLDADTSRVLLTLASALPDNVNHVLRIDGVRDTLGSLIVDDAETMFAYRDVDPGLLAWWTLDEGTGPVATDATGNGHHLDIQGAAWAPAGRMGGALSFDGNAMAVDPSGGSYINGLTALTVAMWIQSDVLDTDNGIFTTGTIGNSNCLSLRHDGFGWDSKIPRTFRAFLSATGGNSAMEGQAFTQTTEWQHVALTWSTGGALRLYLDGQFQEARFDSGAVSGSLDAATQMVIGMGERGADCGWRGLIDDVRVYDRALAGFEVEALATVQAVVAPVVTVAPLTTADSTPELTGTVDDPQATVTATVGGNAYPAVNNGDGTWTLPDDTISPPLGGGTYDVQVEAVNAGGTGTDATTDELRILAPEVVDRLVFYNQSWFDGYGAGASAADDGAIALDKVALRPDQTATFDNYTSYVHGINGVMIDVADLPPGAADVANFQFHVGNSNTPATWAPLGTMPSIAVRPGAGLNGSDRITLVWPNGVVQKQWLEVRFVANGVTGLPSDDVFYFGNAVGESCNAPANAWVTGDDEAMVRNHPTSVFFPAAVDSAYDFNRDRAVNGQDQAVARSNATSVFTALKLITVPGTPPPALSEGEAGTIATAGADDRPTTDAVVLSQLTLISGPAQSLPEARVEPAGASSGSPVFDLLGDSPSLSPELVAAAGGTSPLPLAAVATGMEYHADEASDEAASSANEQQEITASVVTRLTDPLLVPPLAVELLP